MLDLPPFEELRIHVAWFKNWYGPAWEKHVNRELGVGDDFVSNRLKKNVRTDAKTVTRLRRLQHRLERTAGLSLVDVPPSRPRADIAQGCEPSR